MGGSVVADLVPLVDEPAHQGRMLGRVDPGDEERRRDAVLGKDVQQPWGPCRVRPVVEGQHHGASRDPSRADAVPGVDQCPAGGQLRRYAGSLGVFAGLRADLTKHNGVHPEAAADEQQHEDEQQPVRSGRWRLPDEMVPPHRLSRRCPARTWVGRRCRAARSAVTPGSAGLT
jgi:hypothetical protein